MPLFYHSSKKNTILSLFQNYHSSRAIPWFAKRTLKFCMLIQRISQISAFMLYPKLLLHTDFRYWLLYWYYRLRKNERKTYPRSLSTSFYSWRNLLLIFAPSRVLLFDIRRHSSVSYIIIFSSVISDRMILRVASYSLILRATYLLPFYSFLLVVYW
jgi:hypothetical protein